MLMKCNKVKLEARTQLISGLGESGDFKENHSTEAEALPPSPKLHFIVHLGRW